jgi:hypothetical protein
VTTIQVTGTKAYTLGCGKPFRPITVTRGEGDRAVGMLMVSGGTIGTGEIVGLGEDGRAYAVQPDWSTAQAWKACS